MAKQLISVKVTMESRQLLRIIAAYTGEHIYQVLERLLRAELERVENERRQGEINPS